MTRLRFALPFLSLFAATAAFAQTNTFPSSGNVGIGTTSPGTLLTAYGSNIIADFQSSAASSLLYFTPNGYHRWRIGAGVTNVNDFGIEDVTVSAARFSIDGSGNVGIGTTSPASKLHLHNASSAGLLSDGVRVSRPSSDNCYAFLSYGGGATGEAGDTAYLGSVYAGGRKGRITFRVSDGSSHIDAATIDYLGNVGIGTSSPGAKLEVAGTVAMGKNYENVLVVGPLDSAPAYFYINTKIPFSDSPAPQLHITGYNYSAPNRAVSLTLGWYVWQNAFYWTQYKSDLGYHNPSRIRLGTYDDNGTTRIRIEIANDGAYWSSFSISATDHNGVAASYTGWSYAEGEMPGATGNILTVPEHSGMVYKSNGNVGIGTTNPTHKLAVNGTIKAKEVIVETTGWSDYVFAEGYLLQPLAQVEQHIKEHKHLPGIPSAAKVAEQGVSVGDMQAKLLAKIEELTLHQIAQEKRIAALEAENTRLKANSR